MNQMQSIESTQSIVSRAWDRLLGEGSSEGDQSWDEAGGNSLQFLRLLFELEEELDRTLPPGSFSVDMSAADLSSALDTAAEVFSLDETKINVVLFPGVGGDDPLLSALHEDLRERVSIATLKYPGWTIISDPRFGFSGMVEDVCSQVTKAAPTGALHFVGYSYGGVVAFASAIELGLSGREVAFLGLVDTDIAVPPPARSQGLPGFLNRLMNLPNAILRGNRHDNLCRVLAHYLLSPRARAMSIALLTPRSKWLNPDMRFSLDYWLCRMRRADGARAWLDSVTVQPPTFRTLLLRSEGRCVTDPADLGWRRHIPSLEVVPIPGDHFSMLADHHRPELVQKIFEHIGRVPGRSHARVADRKLDRLTGTTAGYIIPRPLPR